MGHTTVEEIRGWLIRAKAEKARWLLVGRDWFDGSDYPISVAADEDPWERVLVDEEKTDRIIEAYDLELDLNAQLAESFAWHLPPRTRRLSDLS